MSESYWTDRVALVYRELEEELIEIIIKRLKVGTNNKKDITQWQFEKLQDLGLINIQTIQKVVQATGQAEEVVEEAFRIGPDTVISQVDRASQQPRKVPKTNIDQIIKGYAKQAKTQLNMTGESVGLWTYGSEDSVQKYRRVIERTASFVNTGIHTLEQAVERASHEILTEGLKTTMRDKHRRNISLDSYVRTVMKTNLARTYDEVRKEHMEDYGMHHVVVGSLVGAREACSKIQGQVVDLRPMEEIPEGSEYKSIYDPYWEAHYKEAGGHHGINCRHPHFPFIPGVNTNNQPQYDEELNEQVAKDQQRQRSLERQIREYKKHLKIAQEFGNQKDIDRYTKLISGRQKALRDHLDGHKYLSRDYNRERAFDFSSSPPKDIIKPEIPKVPKEVIVEPEIVEVDPEVAEIITEETKMKFTPGIASNMKKGHEEKLTELLTDAPVEVKKLWKKHEDELKVREAYSKDGAYYQRGKGVTYNAEVDSKHKNQRWSNGKKVYGKGNYETFFHEFGHAFDDIYGTDHEKKPWIRYDKSRELKLNASLRKEGRKIIKRFGGEGTDYTSIRNKLGQYAVDKYPYGYNGVSDIIDGITKGEVSLGWGHDKSYWKRDANLLGSEAFAHMFSAYSLQGEAHELMKEMFPDTYETVINFIKEAAESE